MMQKKLEKRNYLAPCNVSKELVIGGNLIDPYNEIIFNSIMNAMHHNDTFIRGI